MGVLGTGPACPYGKDGVFLAFARLSSYDVLADPPARFAGRVSYSAVCLPLVKTLIMGGLRPAPLARRRPLPHANRVENYTKRIRM
ncbi:hypothetical protein EVAR_41237_1 [Eumeta japonica]|uniref:Uncharacterized protein n=1 Tax=Eumeta variegata TaxID=151549 RepID=A0A4C1W721_EUMVA|nr:hypothetical protein EVAR_41237_1 [Eumeta japonica]